MKVLVLDFDLFSSVGGGQTVYRRLIETNPDIQFTYYRRREAADAPKPLNAQSVAFSKRFFPFLSFDYLNMRDVFPPFWTRDPLIEASDFAISVAGAEFDIVEVPDYLQIGGFLPAALDYYGVKFQRLTLAMHGNWSTTYKMNWGTVGLSDVQRDQFEEWQYRAVDLRYAISPAYIDEWYDFVPVRAHYLHPTQFFRFPQPTIVTPSGEDSKISLNFIGRLERRKGPDIFLKLASLLPRDLVGPVRIIGPTTPWEGRPHGVDHVRDWLAQYAADLGIDLSLADTFNETEIRQVYDSPALIMLPSRYDTLNLIALEAMFSGCPAVIGSGAGVCRFLRESFPTLPFIEIDIANPERCLTAVSDLLRNYNQYRGHLIEEVNKADTSPKGPTLSEIYQASPTPDLSVRQIAAQSFYALLDQYEHHNRPAKSKLRALAQRLGEQIDAFRYPSVVVSSSTPDEVLRNISPAVLYQTAAQIKENHERDINEKVKLYGRISELRKIDRVRAWNELARLEWLRGNYQLYATYKLRVMRALDVDYFGDLERVAQTLEAEGYSVEAQTARALYGPAHEREDKCAVILEEAFANNRSASLTDDFTIFEDRRDHSNPRVSVIVSLYNAADKLPLFYQTLAQQTLIKQRGLEVIFIDSNSPADEYQSFKAAYEQMPVSALFVRTLARETIQKAWNRGISLARAPYLAFLGADEAVVPDCFEVLSAELDRDSSLDWVIGTSVVAEVDHAGNTLREVMVYDRKGFHQDLAYLETCYLSWVGALYRRSIHDRFGYYDSSFRAAGDTEFKNRVLPYINAKAIARVLGLFRNYPEGQTTASPRAEIEDLRAWYLHRSVAGAEYAFRRRGIEAAALLLKECVSYRKSYLQHNSTDLCFADVLLRVIERRSVNVPELCLGPGLRELLTIYRSLEYLRPLTPVSHDAALRKTASAISRISAAHKAVPDLDLNPAYQLFNDNRYEQHHWPWAGEETAYHHRQQWRYVWRSFAQSKQPAEAFNSVVRPTYQSIAAPIDSTFCAELETRCKSLQGADNSGLASQAALLANYFAETASHRPAFDTLAELFLKKKSGMTSEQAIAQLGSTIDGEFCASVEYALLRRPEILRPKTKLLVELLLSKTSGANRLPRLPVGISEDDPAPIIMRLLTAGDFAAAISKVKSPLPQECLPLISLVVDAAKAAAEEELAEVLDELAAFLVQLPDDRKSSVSSNAGFLLASAERAVSSGDVVTAIDCFKRFLEAEPNSVAGWIGLAHAAIAVPDNEQARMALIRAQQNAPGEANAWNKLGTAYFKLMDFHQAELMFKQALNLDPASIDAMVNLAVIAANDNRGYEALMFLQRAHEIQPQDKALHELLLELSKALGQ